MTLSIEYVQFSDSDPVLRTQATLVDSADIGSPRIQGIIQHMQQVVDSQSDPAVIVGLAAQQLGYSESIILINMSTDGGLSSRWEAFINPKVHWSHDRTLVWEGCLSANGFMARIGRPNRLVFSAFTQEGVLTERELEGHLARTIEHDIDHVGGIGFVARIGSEPLYRVALEEMVRFASIVDDPQLLAKWPTATYEELDRLNQACKPIDGMK